MGRTMAWMQTGDYDWAILDLARVQVLAGTSIEPALFLGKAFYERGDPDSAERMFQELHARVSGELQTNLRISCFLGAPVRTYCVRIR